MDLADLIDLEARLAADEPADPEILRERDRAVASGLPPAVTADGAAPDALLAGWLTGLRRREGGVSLGRQVVRARGLLGLTLAGIGFVIGVGAASAALAYDGQHPVNAMTFLGVFVVVQLLLLSLLLASLLVRRFVPGLVRGVPGFGLLGALVRQLGAWLLRAADRARRRGGTGEGPAPLEDALAALRRVRRRGAAYRPIERWSLVAAMQAFAIAFNVGALLRCLQLVAFTDIAFAWSTTLTVEPGTVHAWVDALAAPWSWAVPDAAPTAELVAATRYVRLEATYLAVAAGRAPDPLLVGGWWPFLVVATAVYGLLPRLALWFVARGLQRRALRGVPLDTPDVQRVLRRLRYPLVETRAAGGPPLAPVSSPTPTPPAPGPPEAVTACALVLWRDAPDGGDGLRRAVSGRLGWHVARVLRAGGIDFAEERAAREALAAGGPEAVLVLAESFESPDKALLAFLRAVRTAVGPRRPVVIGLASAVGAPLAAAPDRDAVRLWREGVGRLADPYLEVEPLGGPA